MRQRKRPFRRYVYRDPDTGREFMCWRGEALDRVVRFCDARWSPLIRVAWDSFHTILAVQGVWRRDVRLREPLT